MKYTILFVIYVLNSCLVHAQLYNQQWFKCVSQPGTLNNTTQMATDRFGNSYMAGTEIDIFEPGFPPHMYLLKIDASGNYKWKKYFNNLKDSSDDVSGLAVDGAGNIYLTGRRKDVTCEPCLDKVVSDIVTTKYNSDGDIIWSRRFSAGPYLLSTPSDLRVSNNGYCMVTGTIKEYNSIFATFNKTMMVMLYGPSGQLLAMKQQPNITGLSGCFDRKLNLIVCGEEDISNVKKPVLIKFNKQGDSLWKKILDEPNRKGNFQFVFADPGGAIYTNGQSDAVNFSQPNIVTVKYSAEGKELWKRSEVNRTFTGKNIYGDFAIDTKGNCYVAGYQDYGATDRDWLTVKYNTNGQKKWSNIFTEPVQYGNYPADIEITKDGNVLLAGNGTPSFPAVYSYNTLMYDSNGHQIWQAYFKTGANNNDIAAGVEVDAAGNIYTGGSGVCVVKYKAAKTSSAKPVTASTNFISPNPASGYLLIEGLGFKSYTITNLQGAIVQRAFISHTLSKQKIDISKIPKGYYFISISKEGIVITNAFKKE